MKFSAYQLIAFLLLLIFDAQGWAGVTTKFGVALTGTGAVRKWKELPVTFCTSDSVPTNYRSSIKAAIAVWNDAVSKKLIIDAGLCRGKIKDNDPKVHAVIWKAKGFQQYAEKTRLATTLTSYDEDSGEIIDAKIYINAEFYPWNRLKTDLTTVLIHEIGHIFGIQHNFYDPDSALNYYSYVSGVQFRKLGEYEINAIKSTYLGESNHEPAYLNNLLAGDIGATETLIKKNKSHSNREKFILASIYLKEKRFIEADAMLTDLLKQGYHTDLVLLSLGENAWNGGKNEQAEAYFKKLLTVNETQYEAIANIGAIELEAGKKQIAQQFFEKALEINPTHYVACFYLYQITRQNKYRACVQTFSPDLLKDLR